MSQLSPLIWVAIAVGVLILIVGVFLFWVLSSGHKHDCTEARYLADRNNPARRWTHGVMAIYQGDRGDPAYWDLECAHAHAAAWDIHTASDLQELLLRYHEGEINVAFDKARLIWLARVGQGARWLPEAQSWDWCERASEVLRQHYADWSAIHRDVEAGKAAWFNGAPPSEEVRQGKRNNKFALAKVLPHVPFR